MALADLGNPTVVGLLVVASAGLFTATGTVGCPCSHPLVATATTQTTADLKKLTFAPVIQGFFTVRQRSLLSCYLRFAYCESFDKITAKIIALPHVKALTISNVLQCGVSSSRCSWLYILIAGRSSFKSKDRTKSKPTRLHPRTREPFATRTFPPWLFLGVSQHVHLLERNASSTTD